MVAVVYVHMPVYACPHMGICMHLQTCMLVHVCVCVHMHGAGGGGRGQPLELFLRRYPSYFEAKYVH